MGTQEQSKRIIEDMARVIEVLAKQRKLRTGGIPDTEALVNYMKLSQKAVEKAYNDLIELGYVKEDARKAIGKSIAQTGKILESEGFSKLIVSTVAIPDGKARA
jgi:DNA-binding transcriptional regulator YhcF (GntR family)